MTTMIDTVVCVLKMTQSDKHRILNCSADWKILSENGAFIERKAFRTGLILHLKFHGFLLPGSRNII